MKYRGGSFLCRQGIWTVLDSFGFGFGQFWNPENPPKSPTSAAAAERTKAATKKLFWAIVRRAKIYRTVLSPLSAAPRIISKINIEQPNKLLFSLSKLSITVQNCPKLSKNIEISNSDFRIGSIRCWCFRIPEIVAAAASRAELSSPQCVLLKSRIRSVFELPLLAGITLTQLFVGVRFHELGSGI